MTETRYRVSASTLAVKGLSWTTMKVCRKCEATMSGLNQGGVGLPEHDVVVGVSLLLELLGICLGEGEEGGHVVHHLLAAVLRLHALCPRLAKLGEEH